MVWTLVEPGVAIVASSLVTIRPLLHAMHIGGFGSTGNSDRHNDDPNHPRSIGGGGPLRTHRPLGGGGMPGFGRGDITLAELGSDRAPDESSAGMSKDGTGVNTSSNSDSSSLRMPAVAGKVAMRYSARERRMQADELPLNRNGGDG